MSTLINQFTVNFQNVLQYFNIHELLKQKLHLKCMILSRNLKINNNGDISCFKTDILVLQVVTWAPLLEAGMFYQEDVITR